MTLRRHWRSLSGLCNPDSLYLATSAQQLGGDEHHPPGGRNYGWPVFEGMNENANYLNAGTRNPDALNPLANPHTCPTTIRFRDLIAQKVADVPAFPNPCNSSVQLPPAVTVFEHARPELAWYHSSTTPVTLCPTSVRRARRHVVRGETGGRPNVIGTQYGGSASIGSDWYRAPPFQPSTETPISPLTMPAPGSAASRSTTRTGCWR